MYIDAVMDLDALVVHLQDARIKTVMDFWNELMTVLKFKAAMLATNAALRAAS